MRKGKGCQTKHSTETTKKLAHTKRTWMKQKMERLEP